MDRVLRQPANPAMNAVLGGKKTPEQALHDVQLVMADRFRSVFGQ
jgi:maltose-binding protein MalE